ncbi:hypothetical protein NUU61_003763 [Penicillium alfredii]|uniref:Life-span regulatory factor-domain-containing protein n=1 Tax=Penicillium alfredii TaxID=1506179 RepID=A0A9W9FJT2_9EURO|nr:uncharacterized protein NUU61_003763 [Penicillium alfredii]KAJ5101541.1 hypothetical protein NUU61_003763 [Penicillium alfredii]
MTQSTSHRRSPSSSHTKSKPVRPGLHRRGTSGLSLSISKLGAGHARGPSKTDDSDLDMASFLNFCAMCERQITVPNNSLLYCSESCRRKDSCKPLSASWPSMSSSSSVSSSYSTTPPTSPPLSPRTIVAPMTPTRAQPTPIPAIRIPSDAHDAKTDLDPTEWKPVLLGRSSTSSSLASSDAWHYLSQFHGNDESLLHHHRRPSSMPRSLPALDGGLSAAVAMPSLTHTPSTAASSFSSTASDYLGSMYESGMRPLPPRHNPCFAGSASLSKGVELVVPQVASPSEDVPVHVSDSGSIFPASSAVWEESPCGKTAMAPINMAPVLRSSLGKHA